MADSTPFLPSLISSGDLEAPLLLPKQSIEDFIEEQSSTSRSRVLLFQSAFVCIAWFFDAQQTFISVFSDAKPSWHCTDNTTCSSAAATHCALPAGSWDWDRPPEASVWSDWDLECTHGPAMAGLPASSFFVGCLAGGFLLPTLADSLLGRKTMLFLMCLAMAAAGVLTPLSPNIWVYAAFRFLGGAGRSTIITSALVLSTEMVGSSLRCLVTTIGLVSFTLGFLSLPGMAYLNRDHSWRYLYLWTSGPGLVYSVVLYFLVWESPRWLAVRGRREEAIGILEAMAGEAITTNLSVDFNTGKTGKGSESGGGLFSSMWILVAKRWALQRLAAMSVVAFGVGMLYYGMPLAVGAMGYNAYVSVAANALFEIPSALLTWYLNRNKNRRSSLVAFTAASALASFACVLLDGREYPLMVAEVIAFFCACTSFNVVLFYGLELFPTCVRNSAMSVIRQSVVLGGVAAPQLVAVGDGKLTYGVMGAAMGLCGVWGLLLPETKGEDMCDTMEEQEVREEQKKEQRTNSSVLLQ